DDPVGPVEMAELDLLGRAVHAGELEVGRAEIIVDDVGVRLVAAGRLADHDRRRHLEVVGDVVVLIEHRERAGANTGRGRVERTVCHAPGAGDRQTPRAREGTAGERRRADDLARASGDVAERYLLVRRPALLLPERIDLGDEAHFAVRLAVARRITA